MQNFQAPSVPTEDNNHSSSSSTSSTSTTLCSPNTESSPSIYCTCTVAPLQSSTSFASFDSPPPGLIVSISQNNCVLGSCVCCAVAAPTMHNIIISPSTTKNKTN
ncbi:hypothetical protein niasHT_000242 [Heterodera trifolii]|uniref:Uncharacterized protein n=1 Tax=Heterodera trifolii TaxID=157864 RepID=A0ABD2LYA5_9BILA